MDIIKSHNERENTDIVKQNPEYMMSKATDGKVIATVVRL